MLKGPSRSLFPTPPVLTPQQCAELVKIDLWANLITHILFIFPIALCISQKKYLDMTVLLVAAIVSVIHHNSDSKGWGTADKVTAAIASLFMFRLFWRYRAKNGWDAYSLSFLGLSTLGWITLLAGNMQSKDQEEIHLASHSLWHVLIILSALVILLPNP